MKLTAHLDALADELDAFHRLLEEESAVLAANQADALNPLIARREVANRRIAELWQGLAGSLGLTAGAGLDVLRQQCMSAAPEAWRRMEELAHQVERMNRLNSRIIDEQLRHTQAAVQVLRNAAGSRTLYGSDGRVSEFLNPHRSIDTA
jgi:flagellar biosynthesis/type III secretory pathway chaperone